MENRVVGQTKTVGFQIGVRRTFPISQEQAWELVTSTEGMSLWLGEHSGIQLQPSQKYETRSGAHGEIRVVKLHEQLRLTWKKPEWERASTVQIRIIPTSSNKTTISFHQEHLSDAKRREEMKALWEEVLEKIGELAQTSLS